MKTLIEIPIGRYTLTFSYENSYESHWETCWVCVESVMLELDWEGTPESNYFNEIDRKLKSSFHDKEYMDELIAALASNPFTITEGEAT